MTFGKVIDRKPCVRTGTAWEPLADVPGVIGDDAGKNKISDAGEGKPRPSSNKTTVDILTRFTDVDKGSV